MGVEPNTQAPPTEDRKPLSTWQWLGIALLVALAVVATTLTLGTAAAQSNVARLRAEVQANPGSVVAWVTLGNALYEGGQFDEASLIGAVLRGWGRPELASMKSSTSGRMFSRQLFPAKMP